MATRCLYAASAEKCSIITILYGYGCDLLARRSSLDEVWPAEHIEKDPCLFFR
jgi:hypothetical protein